MKLNLQDLKTEKAILKVVALVLAFVSIASQVILFTDYGQGGVGKGLLGLAAFGLVACQFVFVGVAVNVWRLGCYPLALALVFMVVVLFGVSVACSAAFLESNVSQDEAQTKESGAVYKMLVSQVEKYQALAVSHQANGEALEAVNKITRAGGQYRQAGEATNKADAALAKLMKLKAPVKSSGGALISLVGENRWWVWFVLSGLIDLCALFCFAVLSVLKTQTRVETQTPVKTRKQEKTKTGTPGDKITLEKRQVGVRSDLDEIGEKIKAGFYGDSPGVRQVMRENEIKSYPPIKRLFDELQASGHLVRNENGKTFELRAGA